MPEEIPPTPPAQAGSAYTQGEKITKINVADEIKNSFLDYSMSVIISRALPDARGDPFARCGGRGKGDAHREPPWR